MKDGKQIQLSESEKNWRIGWLSLYRDRSRAYYKAKEKRAIRYNHSNREKISDYTNDELIKKYQNIDDVKL